MLAPVDEPGVGAERDVVQEDPVVGLADVDAPLDGVVVECGERAERIVAVEPEVAREVVPRAEGDTDERGTGIERRRSNGTTWPPLNSSCAASR